MSDIANATAENIDVPLLHPANAEASTRFLGLAPFLRMSIAGIDLRPLAQAVLETANREQDNPLIWMNLSTLFLCLQLRDLGLASQAQALALQRLYRREATRQPCRFRLLMIQAPGDLSENTPLDCLLENSSVELISYYATPEQPLPQALPEHDAVFIALSDSAENRPLLIALDQALNGYPKPVINPPHQLPFFNRDALCQCLQDAPGIAIPQTFYLLREEAAALAASPPETMQSLLGHDYPVIIRPVGSHAGRDLERIDSSDALIAYLSASDSPDFFLARFVDYRSPDGAYRKYRIALLAGQPYICHMAISAHWMVHYVNAGMYDDPAKRQEEGAFMKNFPHFVQRHAGAWQEIYQRLGPDYMCIDCAETPDGELLIFEIDHSMVVHAMDSADLFPFKAEAIGQLQQAFERYLYALKP